MPFQIMSPQAGIASQKIQYSVFNGYGLTKTPPVQNTWYTACDLTNCADVLTIFLQQINTGAVAKLVEIEVTIDTGIFVLSAPYNLSDSTPKGAGIYFDMVENFSLGADAGALFGDTHNAVRFPLVTKRLKVRFRMTDIPGVAQIFSCQVFCHEYGLY